MFISVALCTIGDSPPHRWAESRPVARRGHRRIESLIETQHSQLAELEGMEPFSTNRAEQVVQLDEVQPTTEKAVREQRQRWRGEQLTLLRMTP